MFFLEIKEDKIIFNQENQDRLWSASLQLCKDKKTTRIAENLYNNAK